MKDQGNRLRLRAWAEGMIEGEDAVHVPELVRSAAQHFTEADPAFVQALLEECMYPILYDLVLRQVGAGRGGVVELADEVVARDEFSRRSAAAFGKFSRWMEHAGPHGHVRLTRMQPQQLRVAATEREGRAAVEVGLARFLRRLANGMKEVDHVEDRYAPEELSRIYAEETDQLRKGVA